MSGLFRTAKTSFTVAMAWALSTELVHSCAVCFGAADEQTKDAINSAVLFMIGITILVLIGITGVVFYSIRYSSNRKSVSE